jgi:peptide/nickel transport system permease protein
VARGGRQILSPAAWARSAPAVVAVNVLVGLGANVIAPMIRWPPTTARCSRPTTAHWLGTDAFGRDVLSRIIYGSRTAMVGFACGHRGTVGAVIGVAVPLRRQGRSARAAVMDIFLAFPLIILALAVVSILGTGIKTSSSPSRFP